MPDQPPLPSEPGGDPGPEEILRVHAAPRDRTVDDHMFDAGSDAWGSPCSFRLQLFTAPGHRPVAVATQTYDEGTSLTNAAERYASRVWELYFPDAPQPPLWIQRQVDPAAPGPDGGYEMVVFHMDSRSELRAAGWVPLRAQQLTALVGAPVDGTRGEGYAPRPEPPEEQLRYEIVAVTDLPEPDPFREACMVSGSRDQPHGRTSCCWYHQQDWAGVSELAIGLIERARREGRPDREIAEQHMTLARELGTGDQDLMALNSMLEPGLGIAPAGDSYTNGNHRSRAMKDAKVARTVVVTWLTPEPE
ncbi:hypothetical protein CP967_00320 [Streptomyces nitrosporeus]|uniref:Uncharacterized protein n=1 Tax=Streptomyces nitrosporeus TaxID=28894 RepID=A0A5J6F6D9_9ACTN|nr:hypothetical protein [Streptomyces nitrosporeus]QEU70615.1 hypothetical protein CP967_00320 [Streptomyces nitrosporeus]GGZ05662.1 hypothetical protein GCM10010327_40140 [Streptomyces nitrosporeus]